MPATITWVKKSINDPDETREFLNGSGNMKVLELGEETVGYVTFNPGWQWSKNVKPKVGTHLCEVTHNLFCISGHMKVQMQDGSEFEIGPGEASFIAPGHDAWIIGDEPFVGIDWTGARTYAK